MNKVIQLGDVGSITVSESAGVASVVVSLNASAGGGQAAGVLKGKASLELDLGAQQVADLAMGLLEAKFPSAAPLLAAAQAEIDNLLKNS